MPMQLLQIGAVCRPHGLRGELRVRLHDPTSTALEGLVELWTGADAGDAVHDGAGLRRWRIATARPQNDGFCLLTLEGLADRSGADGLRGQVLYARREALPELDEDEVYLADLIGCRVVDLEGQEIGRATAVQDIAGNPLLVVHRAHRAEALVPLVPQILVEVDLQARVLRIDPPEGLLDLDVRSDVQADAQADVQADEASLSRSGPGEGP
jgi:16S rRNA processing protein RimM